jgi:hypothetical protein
MSATARLLALGPSGGSPEPVCQCSQALAQLGRLLDLEVDVEHRDADRQPTQVVVAGPVPAGALVDWLDRAQ